MPSIFECICCEGSGFVSFDDCPLCEGLGAFVDVDEKIDDFMIDFYNETIPDRDFYELSEEEKRLLLDGEIEQYFSSSVPAALDAHVCERRFRS